MALSEQPQGGWMCGCRDECLSFSLFCEYLIQQEQAGAELGQAQLKLELDFTSIIIALH